jgi:large subunit ribosomal protein L4
VEGDQPSTKAAAATLAQLTDRPRVLVVAARGEETARLSVRNLPLVNVITADQLNTYDVMVADDVVFTAQALTDFLASPKSGLKVAEAPSTPAGTDEPELAEAAGADQEDAA